jgi:transposase
MFQEKEGRKERKKEERKGRKEGRKEEKERKKETKKEKERSSRDLCPRCLGCQPELSLSALAMVPATVASMEGWWMCGHCH